MRFYAMVVAVVATCALVGCSGYGSTAGSGTTGVTVYGTVDASVVHTR